ncbi:MAG: hypothetical protein SGJ20_01475 [Planctomycetota bacterium]|nr:hypothetical protein [Planctomycetota bacterium]
MSILFRSRYLCLLMLAAMAQFASAQDEDIVLEAVAERETWPAEAEQAGHFGGKDLQQLEKALETARETVKILKHQTTVAGPAQALRSMKGQPGFRAIYSMNPDGSDVQYLASAPGMITSADPQVSSDGTMLALNAFPRLDAVEASRLFVYALSGPFKGSIRDLGYGNTPAWSPDDKQLTYSVNHGSPIGAKAGVWVMNSDGSDRRWLAHGYFPRWSPDGKTLIIHGYEEGVGRYSLIAANVKTGKTRDLLTAPGWDLKLYGANWSTKGDRIVFVGRHQGHDRLATINADGEDDSIQVLATAPEGQTWCGPPDWSPDGKQIVFSVQEDGGEMPRL